MNHHTSKRVWAAVLTLGVIAHFAQVKDLLGDGEIRFRELSLLLSTGELGKSYYSLIGPLFATPLWLAGKLAGGAAYWVISYNLILFVGALVCLARLLRPYLPFSTIACFFTLLLFGSIAVGGTRRFYGEMFSLVTFAVGSAVWLLKNPNSKSAGFALALSAANAPGTGPGLFIFLVHRAWVTRSLKPISWGVLSLLIILGENWLRRGGPFATPYEMSYFNVSPLIGVVAILFSFGKGLLFHQPGLFFPKDWALWSPKVLELTRDWILYTAGLVLIYSRWMSWDGGWYWGPRFFIVAILPASLILALILAHPNRERLRAGGVGPFFVRASLIVLATAWSFWVAFNGLVLNERTIIPLCFNQPDKYMLCNFVPEYTTLFRPFLFAPDIGVYGRVLVPIFVGVFMWVIFFGLSTWRAGAVPRESSD